MYVCACVYAASSIVNDLSHHGEMYACEVLCVVCAECSVAYSSIRSYVSGDVSSPISDGDDDDDDDDDDISIAPFGIALRIDQVSRAPLLNRSSSPK